MQTELVYDLPLYDLSCQLPGCMDARTTRFLCGRHYAQRNKTPLGPAEFIAGFTAQHGTCPYCLEPLGARFEVDHFHGACERSHFGSKRTCRQCLRGMIHDTCNEELKWIELALATGRIDEVAPHVTAYLARRPFLAVAA